jgi:hypothetical protein
VQERASGIIIRLHRRRRPLPGCHRPGSNLMQVPGSRPPS